MIVGYVMVQYLQKNVLSYQKYRIAYIASILVNGLLFFLMFIDSLIQGQSMSCQQVWYLAINGECIFLSIILISILLINQRQQMKKLTLLEQTSLNIKLYNPLRGLWAWIGINVAAQIVNLVESGLFLNSQKTNLCRILDDLNWNEILMLIFVFLTMYSQFIATLVYLGYLRRRLVKSNAQVTNSNQEKVQFQIEYEEYKNSFTLSL